MTFRVVSRNSSMPAALRVRATADDGKATEFRATVRIDTPQELQYYRHGGILEYVLRQLAGKRVGA